MDSRFTYYDKIFTTQGSLTFSGTFYYITWPSSAVKVCRCRHGIVFSHSFSVHTCALQGLGELESLPAHIGWGALVQSCTPGQVASSSHGWHIGEKQPFTLTFTPTGKLKSQNNLTCMSLDCGRKLEYPKGTHADTGRTWKLHIHRLDFLTWGNSADHCTTVPSSWNSRKSKWHFLLALVWLVAHVGWTVMLS